jgi:hypothetical protein
MVIVTCAIVMLRYVASRLHTPFIKAVSQMMRASQQSGGWAGWAGCDECDECDECDGTGNERKQQGGLRTSMSCRFAPRRGKAATLPRALHVTVYPIP